MNNSKESNDNLLFNEVRNLGLRLNEFGETITVLREAVLDTSLDVERLSGQIDQLITRVEYLETITKSSPSR